MLGSFLSNRQNEFRETVTRSSLPGDVKHMLHTVNRQKAWFTRDDVILRGGDKPLPEEVRHLAREASCGPS